jgi:GNAT superfamily N-acetyltransferase
MDSRQWLELLGYLASVLVAVSLMMSRIVRLRLINLAGSLAFAVYGFLIGAYPVAAVNAFICLINLFFLWRMLRSREYFRILEIEPDSEYLRYFLSVHRDDVRRFIPGFMHQPERGDLTFFVLRDLVPAGLFIGELREDGCLWVRLDYVIPSFRDFKIGRYLFHERADYFRERGIRSIASPAGSTPHARYLRRMGFAPVAGDAEVMRLDVG